MIDGPANLIASFAAGLILGALYLGTLWAILRRLSRTRYPAVWLLGSAAFRVGLLLLAWYWVSGGRWEGLLACLAGFLVIRFAATRIVRAGIRQPAVSRG
jgi:F1F0 ATPase subunit 2